MDIKERAVELGRAGRRKFELIASSRSILTPPLKVLWACRVSVTSAVLGTLILFYAPQAQDIFLDFNGIQQSFGFLFMVCVFWAAPLHYSARTLLQYENWLISEDFDKIPLKKQQESYRDISEKYGWYIRWVPRILGLAPFTAICGALIGASADVPRSLNPDLLNDTENHIHGLLAANLVASAVFLIYMLYRRELVAALTGVRLNPSEAKPPVLPFISPEITGMDPAAVRRLRQGRLGGYLVLGLITFFFAIAFFHPEYISEKLPRAQFVALMFGGWLPALTLLSWLSHHWRVPLIFILAVVASLLPAILGDSHKVRELAAETAGNAGKPARITLEQAVHAWRQNNAGCEAPDTPCRPIIVAASGGASRAGYFTAAVLGELMDATCDQGNPRTCGAKSLFWRRLFAISSVSGSSVGAIALASAVEQSAQLPQAAPGGQAADPDRRARQVEIESPCVEDPDHLWFLDRAPRSWRDCAEILMAGDFLSPTMVGLAFRDMLPLPFLGRDRAALLERSWERHYGNAMGLTGDSADGTGLDRPFSTVWPQACEGEQCAPWKPLLVINGASVETGRFIITTPLKPVYQSESRSSRVFENAHDFSDLRNNRSAKAGGECTDDVRIVPEISLSTAAHNSARFPLISPPGNILNACGQIIDRIVDGGYPESSGIISAAQLARKLKDFKLYPIILLITNDPEAASNEPDDHIAAACRAVVDPQTVGPSCPDADDSQWGSWLRAPLGGLLATRSGRAELGAMEAQREANGYFHIRVFPERRVNAEPASPRPGWWHGLVPDWIDRLLGREVGKYKDVSMSWWLSNVVQSYLNDQIDDERNVKQLQGLCETLGGDNAARAACKAYVAVPRPR